MKGLGQRHFHHDCRSHPECAGRASLDPMPWDATAWRAKHNEAWRTSVELVRTRLWLGLAPRVHNVMWSLEGR